MTMLGADGVISDPEISSILRIDEHFSSYMVSHRVWETFQSSGVHLHKFYEILIHHRNGSKFAIGTDVYPMQPNEFYIAAPYHIHSIPEGETMKDYERICIYITEEQLKLLGMGVLPVSLWIEQAVQSGQVRYSLTEEEWAALHRLATDMHATLAAPCSNPLDSLDDLTRVTQIFVILCRAIAAQRKNHGGSQVNNNPPVIQQIAGYINAHYTEPLTLESLAVHFNLSKYYLSHEFSRCMGTSVYQYVLICRITAARQMIVSGDNMLNIALRCGFNDYSSFLRAFTKLTGETPRDFRARRIRTSVPPPRDLLNDGQQR